MFDIVWLSPWKKRKHYANMGGSRNTWKCHQKPLTGQKKHGPQFLPELHLSSSTCRKESKWEMAAQLMSEISSLDSKHLEHVGVFLFGPDCPKFFNRSSPLPNPSKSFGHKIAWWLQGAPESRPQWWHGSLAELGSSSQDGFWFHEFTWMCMWWIETPGCCWMPLLKSAFRILSHPFFAWKLNRCFWQSWRHFPAEEHLAFGAGQRSGMAKGLACGFWNGEGWDQLQHVEFWLWCNRPKFCWPIGAKSGGCHQGSMHWRVVDNGKHHCASCKWCWRRHSSRQSWANKTDQ